MSVAAIKLDGKGKGQFKSSAYCHPGSIEIYIRQNFCFRPFFELPGRAGRIVAFDTDGY